MRAASSGTRSTWGCCSDAGDLRPDKIILIHHTDCGMLTFSDEEFHRQLHEGTGVELDWNAEAFAHQPARRGHLTPARGKIYLTYVREAEMSESWSESEIETLHRGAMGAGLLVSVSDRGFFDTFKEAGVLAKHVAVARGSSESEVVRRVAERHGTGFGLTTPSAELEAGTLQALRSAVELLQSKAPGELEAYRTFVLDLAHSVAAAAPGGDEAEGGTIAKIESALALGGAQPGAPA